MTPSRHTSRQPPRREQARDAAAPNQNNDECDLFLREAAGTTGCRTKLVVDMTAFLAGSQTSGPSTTQRPQPSVVLSPRPSPAPRALRLGPMTTDSMARRDRRQPWRFARRGYTNDDVL